MKKKQYLWFAALQLLLISCSSSSNNNDDVDPTDDGPMVVDRSQNLLSIGDSANDLLSNANFDRLVVQIAFAQGFRPTNEAVTNFENYIRDHTFKQNITVEFLELENNDETEIELNEVAALETENRTAYNDGNTLAVYIYFSDATAEGDDLNSGLVTLGAVYRNTSMVIYERTLRAIAGRSLTITDADLETATLNHEFGHLFGLVNLGTLPVNDHEDPAASNHCVIDGCLMRAELTFGSPASRALVARSKGDVVSVCNLSGLTLLKRLENRVARGMPIVPVLDDECVLDLQSNGGR